MAELDYEYFYDLQKKILNGDSDAFAELYSATYEQQYQFACTFTGDIYLAQDALKNLYCYVLEHIGQLIDSLQLIPWLDQVNFYTCCEMLKETRFSDVPSRVFDLPFHESRLILMRDYLKLSKTEIALAIGKSRTDDTISSVLDYRSADIILSSVLTACGFRLNSVPVSAISSNRFFRRESYALPKAVIGISLFILLLMPFFFITPNVDLQTAYDINTEQPVFTVNVSSLLRVKSVIAVMEDKTIPVYETSKKVYTIMPRENGTAEITVTLENGQSSTVTFTTSYF